MHNSNSDRLPRTVLIVSPEDKISYKWHPTHKNISKDVAVITIQDLEQWKKKVTIPKHYNEGDVLLLHPFDDRHYIHISKASELENAKFSLFTEIAQCLGAVEYKVTSATKKIYEQKLNSDGKLTVPTKKDIHVNVSKNEEFKESMGFELSDTFIGKFRPSAEEYGKAIELMKKYNLEEEDSLKNLIKMRNPQRENVHLHRTVSCNITQELNATLDIALSLTVCACFNLDANVKKIMSSRVEKRVDIEFTFPEKEV